MLRRLLRRTVEAGRPRWRSLSRIGLRGKHNELVVRMPELPLPLPRSGRGAGPLVRQDFEDAEQVACSRCQDLPLGGYPDTGESGESYDVEVSLMSLTQNQRLVRDRFLAGIPICSFCGDRCSVCRRQGGWKSKRARCCLRS